MFTTRFRGDLVVVAALPVVVIATALLAAAKPVLAVGLPVFLLFIFACFRWPLYAIAGVLVASFFEAKLESLNPAHAVVQSSIAGSSKIEAWIGSPKALGLAIWISFVIRLISHPAVRKRFETVLKTNLRAMIGLLLLVIWSLISLLWAEDAGRALMMLVRITSIASLALIVATYAEDQQQLRLLLLAMAIAAVGSALFGFIDGGSSQLLRSDGSTADASGRLAGAGAGINQLAGTLAAAVIAALCMARAASNKVAVRWLTCLALAGVLTLFATGSRGGLLALTGGLAVAIYINRKKIDLTFVLGLVGITGVVILSVLYLAPDNLLQRYSVLATPTGAFENSSGRQDLWRIAIEVLKERPFTGVGFYNFPISAPNYLAGVSGLNYSNLVLDHQMEVHNIFLQMAVELGLPALIVFIGVCFFALRRAWPAAYVAESHDSKSFHLGPLLVTAVIGGFVAQLISAATLPALDSKVLWAYFGLMFALVTNRVNLMDKGPVGSLSS